MFNFDVCPFRASFLRQRIKRESQSVIQNVRQHPDMKFDVLYASASVLIGFFDEFVQNVSGYAGFVHVNPQNSMPNIALMMSFQAA